MLLTVELLVEIPIIVKLLTKIEHSPLSSMNEKGKVMAVMAMAKYGNVHHYKSTKKTTKEKLI
jgi:hypothetical protein